MIKNRLVGRYDILKSRLSKWQYCDKVHSISECLMHTFVEFVEKERPFEIIDFDHDDEWKKIGKELENLYVDIKVVYPKAVYIYEQALHDWSGNREGLDVVNTKEEQMIELEDSILSRIMKYRKHMWT